MAQTISVSSRGARTPRDLSNAVLVTQASWGIKDYRRGPSLALGRRATEHSPQNQPPAQNTFRAHNLAKFLQIFLHRFADNGVAVVAPVLHFARGRFQTCLDLLHRF